MSQFQNNPLTTPPRDVASLRSRLAGAEQLPNGVLAQVYGDSRTLESPQARTNREVSNFYDSAVNATRGTASRDPVTSDISKQLVHMKNMNYFARPTRFYFEFTGVDSQLNERLVRNCMSTSLPGRALLTQPLKIYGPPVEYAYEANYNNEFQMTFRVGEDMRERDYFENWLNSIYSQVTGDLAYPNSYRKTLKVYQLDRSDFKVYCTELYNVFCKSISDIELSTDSSDQIETITVTLAYSEYRVIMSKHSPYNQILQIFNDSGERIRQTRNETGRAVSPNTPPNIGNQIVQPVPFEL